MQENWFYPSLFCGWFIDFSKCNLVSVESIQKVLNLFYTYSELHLNYSKSEIFSTGVSKEHLKVIHQATGFKIGSLPVRYLYVSFVTRILTDRDWAPWWIRLQQGLSVGKLSYYHMHGDSSLFNLFCLVGKISGAETSFFPKELLRR